MTDDESNLIKHAKRELALIDEEEWIVQGYLDMIEIFSKMGHSGGSASVFIPTLTRLLEFKNLSMLTDDPDDWIEVGPSMWQCRRNSEAFSEDGGKTYTLLSERPTPERGRIVHQTTNKD